MSDVLNVPYPKSVIQSNEPGLITGYDFQDNELSTWGKYCNKCSVTGAVYDITRAGTPRIGQGGGIFVTDDANSYYTNAAAIPVTPTTSAYAVEIEIDANPTATRYLLVNGSATGADIRLSNTGVLSATFDRATLSSTAAGFCNGKGPMRAAALFDGVNQHLVVNRRVIDSDAVVPAALAGFFGIGQHGTVRKAQVYRAVRPLAEESAAYVSQFAKRVKFSWMPVSCGEGPAGGILTGSTPGGYATCPSGGATMQFVWRPDLSIPSGGRLALTDSGAISMRRIAIAHTRQPVFGSWDFSFDVRDPLTDDVIIGLTPLPETDPTIAGSGSFWFRSHRVPNPWWRTEVHFENGASIIDVDMADVIQAGDRIHVRVTHDVSGDWRVYAYNSRQNSWYWRNAVGNSVATLTSNYVVAAPRGSYLFGVSKQQGEATPHEAGIKVP